MLRVFVVCACLIFVVAVCRQIAKKKLLLQYSLLWFALAFFAILAALFPGPVFQLADYLGFEAPSNFIFFFALFFLLAICLSLCIAVSWQAMKIRRLVQSLALLKKEVDDSSLSIDGDDTRGF